MVLLPRRPPSPLLGLALAALVVIGAAGCGARTAPHPAASGPEVAVTVQATSAQRAVPFGFLGLSLEYSSIERYAGTDPSALDPVFLQLVRNLVPGQAPVLRIGGDSTDRTWRPAPGLRQPPGVTFSITDRWLAVTRALARALHARLIAGLNLEADSPQLAAAEARGLIGGLGRGAVHALELGNEPDLYPSFPWYRTPSGQHVTGRPPNYDMSSLIDDFTRFGAALPSGVLAGPSLGAPGWTRELGRFLSDEPRVRLVTLHRYPLQLCFIPRGSARYPTVAHLLSPAASIGLADSFGRYSAVARAHGLTLRIDELNTVSCGADRAVSQTFASALWALNTLFEMVRDGIHGVNIHTFPGAGYDLFHIGRVAGRWEAGVAPEYYGLVMFARAAPAGSGLLRVEHAAEGRVRTWATRDATGTIRVLVVNTGTRARRVSVRLAGAPATSAQVQWLSAPGVRASHGVTIGGQSFRTPTFTGLLPGSPQVSTVSAAGGRYSLTVPGASAVLLVAARPGGGSSS